MKLINVLLEEKNKWMPLSPKEVEDLKKQLFDLVDNAYKPLGGHPNVQSPEDIKSAADIFTVIDLDDDPEHDAVALAKNRAGGTKHVGLGHDGSKPARSAAVNFKAKELKSQGNYVEVSGKLFDILKAKGVPVVDDEDTVRSVLKGKEIEWNGDGTYDREIGGKKHTKVMMGKPNISGK